MKRLTLFILALLALPQAHADELAAKIAACSVELNKGNITGAAVISDEILKRDPKNRDGLICKGKLLGTQGKYDEALETLKQAEQQSKEPFEHMVGNILIGHVYKAQQKYPEAQHSYENSLNLAKLDKNEKMMRVDYNLIGDTQTKAKAYAAALESYQAGAKLAMNDNERAESYELLAITYNALGQYDAAIEYQVKCVQMQKVAGTLDDYAESTLVLGQFYMNAKDYVNADKIIGKFAQFAKENGSLYYEARANLLLGQSKSLAGDNTSAKALFTSALTQAKTAGEAQLSAEIEESIKHLAN